MVTICSQAAQATDLRVQVRDTDTVSYSVDSGVRTRPELPARGTTMQQVRTRIGKPPRIHAAVGTPPITRWDYPGYVLYFENNRLLDVVVPNDPVPLVHRDQLR